MERRDREMGNQDCEAGNRGPGEEGLLNDDPWEEGPEDLGRHLGHPCSGEMADGCWTVNH